MYQITPFLFKMYSSGDHGTPHMIWNTFPAVKQDLINDFRSAQTLRNPKKAFSFIQTRLCKTVIAFAKSFYYKAQVLVTSKSLISKILSRPLFPPWRVTIISSCTWRESVAPSLLSDILMRPSCISLQISWLLQLLNPVIQIILLVSLPSLLMVPLWTRPLIPLVMMCLSPV